MSNENPQAVGAPLERHVRPCAWAHRYSPRGLLHALRDNQQDAEDDAAIIGGSAHAVALYDERALEAAVAAERERCAAQIEPKNERSDWTPLAEYAAHLAARIRGA